MTNLCKMFYPQDLEAEMQKLNESMDFDAGT
jgi:hypothetical protein